MLFLVSYELNLNGFWISSNLQWIICSKEWFLPVVHLFVNSVVFEEFWFYWLEGAEKEGVVVEKGREGGGGPGGSGGEGGERRGGGGGERKK